jgi:hypothetical protein
MTIIFCFSWYSLVVDQPKKEKLVSATSAHTFYPRHLLTEDEEHERIHSLVQRTLGERDLSSATERVLSTLLILDRELSYRYHGGKIELSQGSEPDLMRMKNELSAARPWRSRMRAPLYVEVRSPVVRSKYRGGTHCLVLRPRRMLYGNS